jgi:hypothetical protein
MQIPAIDIAGAERKLRQAEFFLNHLQSESREIAIQLRRGLGDDHEPMTFYFSACLSAAQSAFYILDKTGKPAFKAIEHRWRMGLGDDATRAGFNAMVGLRDDDVHLGKLDADALPKLIEADPSEWSMYDSYNTALFGPRAVAEHVNPDGKTVRSAQGLQGSVGLYLEHGGTRTEATTACRAFIDQLRSLVHAVKRAAWT